MSSRFAHNTFFHSVAGLSYALGAFIISIIVARALGVHGAGIFALATWIVTITVTLTDFGIASALMRYLPELTTSRRREDAELLASYLFRIFACSSAAAFSLYAVLGVWSAGDKADLINTINGQPELWIVIGGMCVAQSFATFTTSYWRGMQKFDRVAAVTVLSTVVQISGSCNWRFLVWHYGSTDWLRFRLAHSCACLGFRSKVRTRSSCGTSPSCPALFGILLGRRARIVPDLVAC